MGGQQDSGPVLPTINGQSHLVTAIRIEDQGLRQPCKPRRCRVLSTKWRVSNGMGDRRLGVGSLHTLVHPAHQRATLATLSGDAAVMPNGQISRRSLVSRDSAPGAR